MDADYLKNELGQVVAKGCAETIAAAPVDPIQYLSLWLLKYVESAKITNEFWKEKECILQEQLAKQEKQRKNVLFKEEEAQKQTEAINLLHSIQNDPYLLFDACLQAVLKFTGCSSAYVALVLDKLWEPPKKKSEPEEEESVPNDEEAEEEGEEGGLSGEADADNASQGNEVDDGQQEVGSESLENFQGENTRRKAKPPKPPNYKKKVLIYVAATPNNEFLINKQLDKKIGAVTFSVLLQGLPRLHIANVLYQEGVHFFQGLPLMGAYLTIPILLNATPVQVVALLCADTLRKQHIGTGKPFSSTEQEFIAAVAQAATEVLSTTLSAVSGSYNTKDIIKELQNQIQKLEASCKAELKRERAQNTQGSEAHDESKKEGAEEDGKEEEAAVSNEADETESKGGDDTKDDEDDGVSDAGGQDDDAKDNAVEAEGEDEDKPEVAEEVEERDQPADEGDDQKQMQEVGKSLKQQQKKLAKLQKNFQKCQSRFEKQGAKVSKLEKQLTSSGGALCHLRTLLTTVLDTIIKHKDEEFGRIKQCLFPTATIHRVLKAILHVLGHGDAVVHDWTRSRQALNDDICTAMKNYNPLAEKDLKKWDLCDVYLDGITEEKLSEEAPIGYLGQQWLVVAKKVAFETVKHSNYKTKSEKAAKDFADVELEQMVAEIDLRVAVDEEKKLAFRLEDLQSKVAKEISSSPTDQDAEEEE